MSNDNNLNKKKNCNCSDKYEVSFEEEEKKAKADPSQACDPSNPDYPWVSCGIHKDDKENKKE